MYTRKIIVTLIGADQKKSEFMNQFSSGDQFVKNHQINITLGDDLISFHIYNPDDTEINRDKKSDSIILLSPSYEQIALSNQLIHDQCIGIDYSGEINYQNCLHHLHYIYEEIQNKNHKESVEKQNVPYRLETLEFMTKFPTTATKISLLANGMHNNNSIFHVMKNEKNIVNKISLNLFALAQQEHLNQKPNKKTTGCMRVPCLIQ